MLRTLRRLLPYVGRVRRAFLAGLACVMAGTAISLVAPWVLKYVVDDLTNLGGAAGTAGRTRLGLFALATLALALADGGFRYLTRKLLIGASRQIEYDLRN